MAFEKGNVPWNKGKRASSEHRRRLSEAHLGNTPWNKGLVRDSASYSRAHSFLDENHGHEKVVCESCGAGSDLQWAFLGEVGGWSRNRSDYRVLCRSCHTLLDRSPSARADAVRLRVIAHEVQTL